MRKVNTIVIDRKNYGSESAFYNVVGKTIGLLMDLNYIVVARFEDVGIYIIEFESDNLEFGGLYPYWLFPDEEESVTYCEK